ncbi:TatD-related deoxyribonuclease [Sulfuricella denitrificans skB26]|uniref:TatD-related deoxyribonuclease n=1 Tax=Sulfuricella denitrificans (strain DSM 22764 / NBRC 105220 / skB26) TaxID=1163617 RepID=S6A9M8_SULDS|nr:TatD family hydrolase [Sulfuricella denitrificans]BAN34385.1 TatD-related deoxyribonuclease [Sulfuricella denitrificans skB26]
MLIDTHCHLDAAEFDADRDQVAVRARATGVEAIVVPGVERVGFDNLLATCARYPGCVPALGIHPMYVDSAQPEDLTALREMIVMHHPVAIGEIGLDFFVPDYDRERQEFYFSEQLKIAREFDLPVLLHIRRAQDTVLKFLRLAKVKGGIAHAFNGSRQQAEEFIKLGFKLGFGGAMTYDRATKLRELAATLPLDSIVLETDAPDIPPAFIGKARNSPEYLPRIAETLAELRGMSVAEVVEATTANAKAILKGLA